MLAARPHHGTGFKSATRSKEFQERGVGCKAAWRHAATKANLNSVA